MALADKAAAAAPDASQGEPFQKPDISSAIPPEFKDVVDRVVAAGMKIMYAPASRDDLMKAVQSTEPLPKTLALNITGLMLTIDQKAGKSGIPPQAIGPASMELLGDGCELMSQSGKAVTMDDYRAAAQMMFVMIGKKMGATDAQIMDQANKALPPGEQEAGGAPPDGPGAGADASAPPGQPAPGGPPVAAAAAPPGAPPATATPPPDEQEV